jgi:hypothetical protein
VRRVLEAAALAERSWSRVRHVPSDLFGLNRERGWIPMMHTVPEWDLECYTFAQHSGASV